jgi:hypothetical protein
MRWRAGTPRVRRGAGGSKRLRIDATMTRQVSNEGLVLVFRVARKLDSPNQWRRHHMSGHKLMTWWAHAFNAALALEAGCLSWAGYQLKVGASDPARPFLGVKSGRLKAGQVIPVEDRRRVSVVRLVPKRANFLRDDDDLAYTVKPVHDALVNGGFLLNDRREFLESAPVQQGVSPDGLAWTIVTVGPASAPWTVRSEAEQLRTEGHPLPQGESIIQQMRRAIGHVARRS